VVQEDRCITVTNIVDKVTSAVDLLVPSFTRTLCFTKYVQGGCQSCLHMSTTGMCENVHSVFTVISLRRGFPAADCHRQWKIGCTTVNL
jgi:hypothetical protein